jgi:glycerol-3-phosphate acyltransferase PlsX
MAAGLWHLKRLSGVSRPAIAAIFPTLVGNAVVVDVGANVDCKPRHLLQFAVMGSNYSRAIFGIPNPRIGLLTIGEEEGKGNDLTVETHPILKASGLNYVGHVEGRDLPAGVADVFVCDGFVGNVLLKFGEGLAAAVLKLIKNEVRKHPLAIFGKVLLKGAFKELIKRTDPSEYGGAPLLGVNGVALICHGGADARAIKNAVRSAAAFVESGINRKISDDLHAMSALPAGG